jgi:hypothetical protein
MFAVLVAVVLLIISVGAIYLLLKSMGQDGVEVAAPGSCRSGKCGVQKTQCHPEEDALDETDAIEEMPTPDRPQANTEQQRGRSA